MGNSPLVTQTLIAPILVEAQQAAPRQALRNPRHLRKCRIHKLAQHKGAIVVVVRGSSCSLNQGCNIALGDGNRSEISRPTSSSAPLN